jgi:hypothetical protein
MEINVSELQVGDEFLFASNGTITRAKVIRPIKVKKNQPEYNPRNVIYYASVKCKVAVEDASYTYTFRGSIRTVTKTKCNASDKFTVEKFINLNYKNLWLVKRDD